MARVAKVDNALKKRLERKPSARAVNTRQKMVYFLIVCEGEKTEPNYFAALEKELPRGTVELRIDGSGRNTISLVEHAIKQKRTSCRSFDRVWVVFDRDSFPSENFNAAIIKSASHGIGCAWSNEAFELWFLLHFQLVTHAMSRTEYASFIEREIRERSRDTKYVYRKNSTDTYQLLKMHGNQKQAIDWAKRLMENFTDQRHATHNPVTRVHELIEELTNPAKVLEAIER